MILMRDSNDNTNNSCEKCTIRHKPNKELLEVIREAENIASRKIKTKGYRVI